MLALVDADYRFRIVEVGDFGRASGGGVFANSALGRGMDDYLFFYVPEGAPLPGYGQHGVVPYMMIGDAAFPLTRY